MGLLLRILFVIPIGFVLAVIAAGLFFVVAAIGIGPQGAYFDRYLVETIVLVAGVAAAAGAIAAIPALAVIVVAEAMAIRSVLFYLVAGAVIGFAGEVAARAPQAGFAMADLRLFVASGAVGGFVYWLVAGRGAGARRDRAERDDPEPSLAESEKPT